MTSSTPKASQAAVTAVQEALGCDERENVKTGEHYCGKHRHLWLDKGCQDAVIAANAVIGADAPAIAADELLLAALDLEGGLGVEGMPQVIYDFRLWLRARADQIEAGA